MQMLLCRRLPRRFLTTLLCSAFGLAIAVGWDVAPALGESPPTAVDKAKAKSDPKDKTLWYDVRDLGLEGQGWSDTLEPFDRFPSKAKGVVRDPVWNLSRNSAGLAVRFATDATTISARWTLRSSNLAMNHMPATGVSGLDLYIKNDKGQWRWLGIGRPTAQTSQGSLVSGLEPGVHEFMLYLPLYNGVSSVEIGLPPTAMLSRLPRSAETSKPIIFYGTSITQGGCASRPGMAYAAILGRWLDRPSINLGFSGNGKMEPEVAKLLAELDPCVYFINCLPNMSSQEVAERVEPFVKILRQAHPTTPIVLAEDRSYTNAPFLPSARDRHAESRKELRGAYDRLVAAGVPYLTYVTGEDQLGDDGEATVDASHPTDLGFLRMAEAFKPKIEPLLKQAK